MSLEAGGVIPCLPNPAITLLVNEMLQNIPYVLQKVINNSPFIICAVELTVIVKGKQLLLKATTFKVDKLFE